METGTAFGNGGATSVRTEATNAPAKSPTPEVKRCLEDRQFCTLGTNSALQFRHKQCFTIKNYAHHFGSGSGDVFFKSASMRIQISVQYAHTVLILSNCLVALHDSDTSAPCTTDAVMSSQDKVMEPCRSSQNTKVAKYDE